MNSHTEYEQFNIKHEIDSQSTADIKIEPQVSYNFHMTDFF